MAVTWNKVLVDSDIKDEDDMASDSATHLATQQSIKAYVDAASEVITGSYTGNNTNNRQITVGAEVRAVIITEGLVYGTYPGMGILGGYCIRATTGISASVSVVILSNAGLKCHASDGFIVGDDSGTVYNFNVNASVYKYVAFKA